MATSDDHAMEGSPPKPVSDSTPENMAVESNSPNTAEPSASSQAQNPSATVCGVCETNPSKYKCPRCYLPYCSVACNRIHKENHPADPEPAPRISPPAPQPPAIDALSLEGNKNGPFQILEHSEQLQFLFKKYPRLRAQLLEIHAATLEPPSAKSRIPASLLKDLPNKGDGWTAEKGIESGKAALRKAQKAAGEDGEAIREYTELVLHFMDKSNSKANG